MKDVLKRILIVSHYIVFIWIILFTLQFLSDSSSLDLDNRLELYKFYGGLIFDVGFNFLVSFLIPPLVWWILFGKTIWTPWSKKLKTISEEK
tara:strand:- start:4400 stop:4675 length:276 start_codon:yes stop_codon:yes gene_type:complete